MLFAPPADSPGSAGHPLSPRSAVPMATVLNISSGQSREDSLLQCPALILQTLRNSGSILTLWGREPKGRQSWEKKRSTPNAPPPHTNTHHQVDVLSPLERPLTSLCLSQTETKPPPPSMFPWGSICSLMRAHHPQWSQAGPGACMAVKLG